MRRFLNGIILLLLGLSVAAAVCMVLMLLQENGLIHWAWVAEVDAWFSQTSHAVGFCLALWGSLILFRLIDRWMDRLPQKDGSRGASRVFIALIAVLLLLVVVIFALAWWSGEREAFYFWLAYPIVFVVLLVYFLVGERKDAELIPVLSIPMNQPQARTWTIVSGAEALAAFAGEFQEMTGQEFPENLRAEESAYAICCGYALEELYCYGADRRGGFSVAKAYYYARARLHEVEESALNLYRIEAPVRLVRDPRKIDADDTEIVRLD